MKHSERVVIVGGGVIGCSIAYYLSKRDVAVTLLERGEIGAQASGAAAGLFSSWKPLAKMDAYNRLLFASQVPEIIQPFSQERFMRPDQEYDLPLLKK